MGDRINKILIGMLIGIFVILASILVYLSLNKDNSGKAKNKKEKEEKVLKYSKTREEDNEIEIGVKNKKLDIKINSKDIKVEGIDADVVDYKYDSLYILVRTNKDYYLTKLDDSFEMDEVYFKKIDTLYKIDNFTSYIVDDDTSGIGILTNDNKKRGIIENDNTYSLSEKDYALNIVKFEDIVIRKDKTLHFDGSSDTNIKFLNTVLKVERIYFVSNDLYYIVANNNLYRLDKNNLKEKYKVVLIGTELTLDKLESGMVELNESQDLTLTYTDNSASIMKDVTKFYVY